MKQCSRKNGLSPFGKFLDLLDGEVGEAFVGPRHVFDRLDLTDFVGLAALEAVNKAAARGQPSECREFLRVEHEIGVATFIDALRHFLLGRVIAVELIEADVVRPHADAFADMPLADQQRCSNPHRDSSLARLVSPSHGFFVILSPARIGRVSPVRTGSRPVRIADRVGVQVCCA